MTLTRPCACTIDAVRDGESLLGSAAELCDAFFHVRETPEGALPLCCLRHPDECEGRNTVIVACLTDGGTSSAGGDSDTTIDTDAGPSLPPKPPLLLARYHNRDKNHHAERVMMEDWSLLAALRALPEQSGGQDVRRRLQVFISLQPCHHSSSTVEISCTEDLFSFHKLELLPRQVRLGCTRACPSHAHPACLAYLSPIAAAFPVYVCWLWSTHFGVLRLKMDHALST